jgi:hypothetical protein
MMPGPPPPPPGPQGPPPRYPAPQAGPGYPAYPPPQWPPPGPPRRKRATVFVVVSVVVFVVAAAVLTTVYLTTSGDSDDNTAGAGTGDKGSKTTEQVASPPAACTLLSPDQFKVFVPGELEEPVESPEQEFHDGTKETACTWRNIEVYGEVPAANLTLEASVSPTEDLARQNMSTSIGKCGEKRPAVQEIPLPGTDEACQVHSAQKVETKEFIENVSVFARKGTVVVHVRYYHSEALIDEIDIAGQTMAAAALAKATGAR